MNQSADRVNEAGISKKALKTLDTVLGVIYVMLICVTVLGDATLIRRRIASIGTLSKIVSMGTIGLAALRMLIYFDMRKRLRFMYYLLLMLFPLIFGLLWSFGIWIHNFEDISMMIKGLEKLLYQFINAFVAISAIILFREKAIDYTFDGIVLGNMAMALLGVKEFGVGPSIRSVMDGVFGGSSESYGFMATMEINDVTFAIGLFLLYYIIWGRGRKFNLIRIAVGALFFVLGFKRIAIFGLLIGILSAVLCRRLARRGKARVLTTLGAIYLIISFFYVWFVRSGLFTQVTRQFGIETMGRNRLYSVAEQFYDISVLYVGYGLQVVGTLMSHATNGELTALHNDILVFYIELGFFGFFIWFGYYYIVYTHLLSKHCSPETAAVYIACISYMMITYFTDNTFFYYWDSYCMRLIPLAFSLPVAHKASKKWKLPFSLGDAGWKKHNRRLKEDAVDS